MDADTYRYAVNVSARQPVTTAVGTWGRELIEIVDGDHPEMVAQRRAILDRQPHRSATLPHMTPAAWDALVHVLQEMADSRPDVMHLAVDGDDLHWRDDLLGEDRRFRFGDQAGLGMPPLTYLARQLTEDVFLLDRRGGDLFVDAAAATFTGSWSSSFSVGMPFGDLHRPVPRIQASGLVDRTRRFLTGLPPGEVVRRLNWTVQDDGEWDAGLESRHLRDPGRADRVQREGAYGDLRLRVEVQHLLALPASGAVLFLIKTHLTPFADIAAVPPWAGRLRSVLAEMPEDMAAYKGFARHRPGLIDWWDHRLAAL